MTVQLIYVGGLTQDYDHVKAIEIKPGGDLVIRWQKNKSTHTPITGVAIIKIDMPQTVLTLRDVC